MDRRMAWAAGFALGAATFAAVVASLEVLLEAIPGGRRVLLVPLAVVAAVTAVSPRPWGTVAGVVLGLAGALGLMAMGLLYAAPEACSDPEVFCEGPGESVRVLAAGAAALPGALLGAGIAAMVRRVRKVPAPR